MRDEFYTCFKEQVITEVIFLTTVIVILYFLKLTIVETILQRGLNINSVEFNFYLFTTKALNVKNYSNIHV